jgi:hypothetical protein
MIDGHMRVAIAISEGETEVPITYVDLSEGEEKAALALFDSIGSLAITDPDQYQLIVESLDIKSEPLTGFIESFTADNDYLSFDTGMDRTLEELPKAAFLSTTYSVQIGFDTEQEKIEFAQKLASLAKENDFEYTGDYLKALVSDG